MGEFALIQDLVIKEPKKVTQSAPLAEEGREPKALLGDVQIDRAFYIKGLPQTNNIAILTNIMMNQERDQAASVALDGAMVVLGGLSHNPINNITN